MDRTVPAPGHHHQLTVPIRKTPAVLLAAAALLAVPAAAAAHGFFLTPRLPFPVWLFGIVAGLIVVGSFAAVGFMWRAPLLTERRWRPTRLAVGPVVRTVMEMLAGALGVLILVVVIWSGREGSTQSLHTFATVWVFVIFWTGLPLLHVLFGDVFRALNPWRAVGRIVGGAAALYVRPPAGQELRPLLAYPAWLGRWPAVAGVLGFVFLELASSRSPGAVADATVVYTAFTFVGMALFGTRAWIANGEAFSVYFNLFARMSAVETRDGRVGLRRPLSALVDLPPAPGTVALVAVMVGSVSYDGASGSAWWQSALREIMLTLQDLGLSPVASEKGGSFIGIVLFCIGAGLVYHLGVLGMRAATGGHGVGELGRRFATTLVPIALAYLLAHYLTLLIISGQNVIPAVSDPLGDGSSDWFGTADVEPDPGTLSPEAFWYLQIGALVAGHVAAVALAHDLALQVFRRATEAVRSQLAMLLVMVGFTVFALWLLSEAAAL